MPEQILTLLCGELTQEEVILGNLYGYLLIDCSVTAKLLQTKHLLKTTPYSLARCLIKAGCEKIKNTEVLTLLHFISDLPLGFVAFKFERSNNKTFKLLSEQRGVDFGIKTTLI